MVIMTSDLFQDHRFQLTSTCCQIHNVHFIDRKFRVNDNTHLMHVTEGRGTLTLPDRTFSVEGGDALAIPAFTKYSMEVQPAFEMLNFHFKLFLVDGELLEERFRLPYIFRPKKFADIVERLRTLFAIRNTPAYHLRFAGAAHEISAEHILEQGLIRVADKVLDPLVDGLAKRLRSSHAATYSADELARFCHLSKSQMNRKFKQYFNMSPRRYWERQRFQRACSSLRNSGKSLIDIADEHGFADQAHFSRWFKAVSGRSPGEFREIEKHGEDYRIIEPPRKPSAGIP